MKYDQHGNETEVSFYDANDHPVTCDLGYAVMKKEYNKQGQIIKESYFDSENKPAINKDQSSHKLETDYDEKGNKIEIRYFGADNELLKGEFAIIRYAYDDAGWLIEQSTFGDDNKPYRTYPESDYYRIVYERNAAGELLNQKYYKLNGQLLGTLDAKGNRVFS